MDELEKQLASLSPAKRALLKHKRKQAAAGLSLAPRLRRRIGRDGAPLSFAQQRLWLMYQMDPNSYLYNVPRAVRMKGRLDLPALEQSLNKIVQRHEVLRTTFSAESGQPVQKVAADVRVALPLTDLSGLKEDQRDAEVHRLALEQVRYPFDLARGPLLRARVVRLGDQDHVLVLAMHHIVSDGWTGGILFDELGELYQAFSCGQPSPLPELPIQYADYAVWQRDWMQGEVLDKEVAYWRAQLAGAPSLLELPIDHPRPDRASYQGKRSTLLLPRDLSDEVKSFSQRQGVTLFTTLLSALNILLFRWTGHDDLVIGTVSANRNQMEVEKLIGCFMNFLPLRDRVAPENTVLEHLAQVNKTVLEAFAHQDCPFEKLIEALNPQRALNANPLYNVALLMQNFPEIAFRSDSLEARFLALETEVAFLDLRFIATEAGKGIHLECEYSIDLFDANTIEHLLASYQSVLEQLVAKAETKVADFEVSKGLAIQAVAARKREQQQTIAIVATFTTEPLEESLDFWMRQLRMPSRIEFAPYNQVFQQLLDPSSLLAQNQDGVNVVLVRMEDWQRFDNEVSLGSSVEGKIECNVQELIAAVKTAVQRSSIPYVLCLCPLTQAPAGNAATASFSRRMEARLISDLNETAGVHVITSSQLLHLYPVADYEDEYANKLGHIPYTPAFFIALGTMIARRIQGIRRTPHKVIVLDCDHTLWKGVCGEDGPLGVEVDAPRRGLQEFMISQHYAGMVLCLCSKNAEEDVTSVFEQNPGMALRLEHIVASRINWRPKSENLKELAEELQLSLDSFVFVDDNPLECAEVQANCPEVLILQLPEPGQIAKFLHHVWAFDHAKVTREDAQRTFLYRQNVEREQLRKGSASLEDFLEGLELKIDIHPMQPDEVPRVAQLTERTNQFNFTTIRRSESEIEKLCHKEGTECLVIDLRDRFGDYGLVGVIIFSTNSGSLAVDTFLLSCRALGRKVEHRMLAGLGAIAEERGLGQVDITYVATSKNRPARDFLESVGSRFKEDRRGQVIYRLPASYAASAEKIQGKDQAGAITKQHSSPPPSAALPTESRLLTHIAAELCDVDLIARAIESQKVRSHSQTAFVAPRTPTEEILTGIWARLLPVEKVGIHDNFFALGGHSLLAAQVIARIRHALGVELPLRAMFEAPTVGKLSERVEVARQLNRGLELPPLARAPRKKSLPLSFAQQRLWFLDQLEPGNPLYNIPQMIRIRGVLSVDALQKSINEVTHRHEALQTTFATADNLPVQVISPELKLPLVLSDLSDVDETRREAEAQQLAKREALRPFDLSKGPLLRVNLLRLNPEEHLLLLNMHHVVGDRWSMGLLAEELTTLYAAFTRGKPSPLPELPVQYADYAMWQRRWLQGETLEQQIAYWKKLLSGAPAVLELPTDRPRPAAQSYRGSTQTLLVPQNLVQKLTALSQTEGVTFFMTLLAAFQTLLARYSGQEDIVVGSPIAGRNYAEIESLIGFFVNTLALRADLSGNPTFRELLARVKEVSLGAYAHQDIPFEKLVEELQPERSLSHNPIFQVMFALQNAPLQALELPGLRLERVPVYTGTSMFDMSWFAIEVSEGLLLRAEYNTDLFDDATITRALRHYRTLLEEIAVRPERRLSELKLLTEAEHRQVLIDFNATGADYPKHLCIHDFFEAQVRRTPDSVALVCGEHRLTYHELNARANQLAHFLRKRGVGPEVLVGVCTERSAEMLVGILGVLKAGGAYVPLDPSYPKERLGYILEDARAPIVLTQESLAHDLSGCGAQLICLDTGWAAIAREPDASPTCSIKPENLGYVLFTSGSTGRPKGVALEHRSAAAFIHWAQTVFTPQELEGVLFSTSICFDLSVFEMFVPLSAGGKVIVAQNALYLSALPAKDEVTLINTVPSAMAELLRMNGVPESVKTANLAGEALPDTLVEQIYSGTAVERVYNLYGPTEDTTYSTYMLVPRGVSVTIGRPISNTQAYILDAHLNLTPIGVSGELYLAGQGLARGYYGRPDLTEERFVPNPFTTKGGARMYRTGDLCRWLPDGNIQYLGRIDHQVKLRGFRIELGEIEAVLARHPDVRQSVVMAREDEPGLKRLVAYVVPSSNHAPQSEELRNHVKQSLPEFMVPAVFMVLDAFPLTPNGKVNRRALPVPEYAREAGSTYVAPRTPVEEGVAAIWAQVLRLPQVGIQDHFFALGGHSLLATQVVSRLRQSFGIELPLRAMFEAPTVAALAGRIPGMRSGFTVSTIQRVPRDKALPASFAQQRLWFLNQLEPNNPLYNVPLAIRMSGVLHLQALTWALKEIVRRHEVLRTTFAVVDGQPVQVLAPDVVVEIPTIDLSGVPAEDQEDAVRKLAVAEAQSLFNLEAGPVFHVNLLRLGEQDHVLLLNTHHIASDGWSIWQFIRELAGLYEARLEGKPSPLPELPIQYADYAVWQRAWMQGEVLEHQLSYWKKQLEGAPATLELPADRLRPAIQSYRGATQTVIFPKDLSEKLYSLSRSEGATLFMTLLAAYQTLLFRYTGQEDIVIGSPIANRNRSEIEDLIGFFVNSLVLRTDVSGNPTFRELLHRVRAVALDGYAHQDLPFEKLVEALQPERDLSRTPLFQVWFALQNAPRSVFKLPGLELKSMDVHNGTSKFDLGIFMVEKPEGLSCMAEYSTDLFDAITIQRLLGHFRMLLEGIAENPDERIAELPLLTETERQQLVVEWNDTSKDYPRNRSLHGLIEEQVERTPDAPALVFESQQLTYRELNARANQLAHLLRKRGVKPEVLVGLCIERSPEMVVALLGILKAGGAYVPLDPAYPRDRIKYVLDDARVEILLTQGSLRKSLPATSAEVLCLDPAWKTIAQESQENVGAEIGPENLAYVIYTSGSTGQPKGVQLEHRSAVTFVHWAQSVFTPPELAGVLFSTSMCFDLSVFEIFVPLSMGGKVILGQNALFLPQLPSAGQVTLINTVPSAIAELVRMNGVPSSVQVVNLAGEALSTSLAQQIYEKTQVSKVYNLYGPTEDTTYSTYTLVPRGGEVTIGRPLANTQVYILDANRQPTPIGVPGELHLAGEGLARGYFGRPDLTAERFVPNPFSAEPGARMYRTGDLARYRRDGNVEFLGRMDHQVKIRGFRIELGEIETTMDSHPGVRQSVALAREDITGDKRLVAYIVPNPDYRDPDRPSSGWDTEQVSHWGMTWDEIYRGGSVADASFNIRGWNSSYTGQPIPAEEMREWVETTVERIRALRPKRVWEIGCGTGLLLFRIAPHCESYYGTDVSQSALNFLHQQLQRPELNLPQVSLEQRPAHEFDGSGKGQFDTVVLNSVAQYFPDLEYLIRVLRGAVESMRPGGAIFLGDVRSLRLLEAFHTSVQLYQAPDSLSRAQLWQRVQKNMRQEGELVIDPAFFTALRRRIPQISRVEIQLKRGRARNELARFRYDVVLHVANESCPRVDCAWLDWNKQGFTPDSVREILRETQPEILGLTGVPNARLERDIAGLKMLASGDAPATVGELRQAIESQVKSRAVEPEDLWGLGQNLQYALEIRPSIPQVDGCCDVLLRRKTANGEVGEWGLPRFPGETDLIRPWDTYANNPLRQKVASNLVPQVRRWLAQKLPEYMLPSSFVLLDSMPLLANGKVNRRALPAPDQSRPEGEEHYVAPRNQAEEMVASIWADVLRLQRVGVDENFFELGGHSLTATQAVSRIRQAFQVELPLRTLFESPTVAALAAIIEGMQRTERNLLPPAIVRAPRDRTLPLSFAQQRLWFLDQLEPNNPLYNVPRAIRMSGVLHVEPLEKALNAIVQRHELLRTTYGLLGDQPVQVIAPELTIKLHVTDLSMLPGLARENEARRIVDAEAAKPFNLAKDPIMRALLLRLDVQDHILFLNTHHIASDGWSTSLLLNELAVLYEVSVEDKPSPLPELPIQYADYAVWQRNWLQGEILEKQLAYWRAQLNGAPPLLSLPTNQPRPAVQKFRGAVHNAVLPKNLADGIRMLSRQQGVTLFMTMLAAFQGLLLHYTEQTDIVVGTDVANRTNVQTEALIGFFVNLLILRTNLSGDPSFRELMGRVREVTLGAYAHQDVPFDKLVEELRPERSLSHNPLVQVLFVQQNTARRVSDLPGVKLSSFKVDVPSKFDVAVFVTETDDGIGDTWVYNPDLFEATTITRMASLYEVLLRTAAADPEMKLRSLAGVLAEAEKQQRGAEQREFQEASLRKLKKIKRKVMSEA